MKKKFKGFTLVELIVVIAIIGVLAAILVPNMMGYISKSKLSSANTAAKNVHTAVTTFIADQQSMGKTIASSDIELSALDVSGCDTATGDVEAAIYNALEGNANPGFVWSEATTNDDGAVTGANVVWADNATGTVWGQFPNPQSDYTVFKEKAGTIGTWVSDWDA